MYTVKVENESGPGDIYKAVYLDDVKVLLKLWLGESDMHLISEAIQKQKWNK